MRRWENFADVTSELGPELSIETSVLKRFSEVIGLYAIRRSQVRDRASDFKHPNKELLCVEHAFEAFVPQVIVGWEELATIDAENIPGRGEDFVLPW
jgi:hypothetical protein